MKRIIGFLAGIAVFLILYFAPIEGLSHEGQTMLALLIMTVIFWATQIVQPGFSAGLFLMLLIVFKVAGPETIFAPWLGPVMWLIIGAYIIANAVASSGLGERIAYSFIIRFVNSYRSIIISIFVLNIILSLFIPHPFPKAFLILSVMKVVMDAAKMCTADRIKVGFTVFAAAPPTSMLFLTGDSSFAPLVSQFAGVEVSWLSWIGYMIVPALVLIILTCLLIFIMFKPKEEVNINKDEIRLKLAGMGKFTSKEIRTVIWLVIAIALWMTDSIHGINVGWITLIIAMGMSLPIIGEVIKPSAWSDVPVATLMFLSAALAISKVGAETGMTDWLFKTILPGSLPASPILIAALIAVIAVVLHLVLGSCIAVMGLVCPAMVGLATSMDISPLIPAFITYTAIYSHYIFPHHNLPILVGSGEDKGGYSAKETIRMGLPLTIVVFIVTCLVEVGWFKVIGLW
ncbi:SLC13 family permease [Parasporobacterium paucivorans]|uniref:Sodium-dependent dicarboxylate transporter SdcS n=1 Tax=Parasporobacterium paucivorans DSM 15970 TaxID=1122934 RepID=A0A1M6L3Z4_9FIRM|nr:SLC13 family permease [Parasporobacterium paucivorans]SHJ65928.1 anion transporter [Parasporobacterium paucivorans DSM 15970]